MVRNLLYRIPPSYHQYITMINRLPYCITIDFVGSTVYWFYPFCWVYSWFMNRGNLQYFTHRKNKANIGIIPPILTFNQVRENSQVVIIYPFIQLNEWFYHVLPMISPSFHGPPLLQHLQRSSTSSSGCRSKGASLFRSAKPSAFAIQVDWKTMENGGRCV